MRKIAIVVNSRANYARIKSVIKAVHDNPNLELCLVVGASALLTRFGDVRQIIEGDGFPISAKIYSIVEGENPTTMAKSTGLAISELATVWENHKPDIVLTVADRFETIATAISASYMNIPVAHTQGGEKTGSIDESVRHAVTKLSHIHFPATEKAKRELIKMGEDPLMVFNTGCPAMDLLKEVAPVTSLPNMGVGPDIDPTKPYLVVLQHPVTTEFGDGRSQIMKTFEAVKRIKMPTIWLGPNPDAGSDDLTKVIRQQHEEDPSQIHFYTNFDPRFYASLIYQSSCLIGNSSSGIREGAYLGVPVVNIGTRQKDRERGANVMDVDYDADQIYTAIAAQANQKYDPDYLYGDGEAGERIAAILEYINVEVQK